MGTSAFMSDKMICLEDHPHAYGDKLRLVLVISDLPGSSPRVWGQGDLSEEEVEELGIIPTRMGTSLSDTAEGLHSQDHPHAYGDKTLFCVSGAE